MRYLLILMVIVFSNCSTDPSPKKIDKTSLEEIKAEMVGDSIMARFVAISIINDYRKINYDSIQSKYIEIKNKSNVKAMNYIKREYDITFP